MAGMSPLIVSKGKPAPMRGRRPFQWVDKGQEKSVGKIYMIQRARKLILDASRCLRVRTVQLNPQDFVSHLDAPFFQAGPRQKKPDAHRTMASVVAAR